MTDNAKEICKRLQKSGHAAYFVGGAVRDMIRGTPAKDIDIVTNAKTEKIKSLFSDCSFIQVGEAFGIVILVMNGEQFEIAQFRSDGKSSDGRHPDEIHFCETIEEDLARRDFTMNAIAFDPIFDEIIDPFNGKSDIKQNLIRFVGDPIERIKEDHLRVLRAFRFMSQLNFSFEQNTFTAIKQAIDKGNLLSNLSQERITAEFSKILIGKNCFETIKLMAECDLLWQIIPELKDTLQPHNSPWHLEEVEPFGNSIFSHILKCLSYSSRGLDVYNSQEKLIKQLAVLFHDIGKPSCREQKPGANHDRFLHHDYAGAKMTETILKRMKFSNEIIIAVIELVKNHMHIHDLPKMKDKAAIRRMMGRSDFKMLFDLGQNDTMATEKVKGQIDLEKIFKSIDCMCNRQMIWGTMLPAPIITGNDLINAKAKPGPHFKKALEIAYDNQLRGIEDKQKLINQAISHIKTMEEK